MKKFWADFKAFITKGNVVDMAVGVIIGGAFGKIVTSLVNDIVMPLVTLMVGGVSVADWKWIIKPEIKDAAGIITQAESSLHYGNFLQTILDFLIIAFFIFLALRLMMNAQKQFGKLGEELKEATGDEKRTFKQQLKTEGKSGKEIKAAWQAKEAADAAAAKAKADAAKAEADAAAKANAPETILKEIRDLLAADRGDALGKSTKDNGGAEK